MKAGYILYTNLFGSNSLTLTPIWGTNKWHVGSAVGDPSGDVWQFVEQVNMQCLRAAAGLFCTRGLCFWTM